MQKSSRKTLSASEHKFGKINPTDARLKYASEQTEIQTRHLQDKAQKNKVRADWVFSLKK